MAFEKAVIDQCARVARKHGIEPAALLTVVEVESAGKSMEADGTTPRMLFERHVFYRELAKRAPAKLQAAVNAGLAIPKWNRATQYKDQATSKGRLTLLARARAIDEECAIRSCSWGVGQTMGFLAEEQGFKSAKDMFAYMVSGGVPAQVDCMVREIRRKKLIDAMNRHRWADFARVYNGPGYKQNQYDTKMAAAYARWKDVFDPRTPTTEPEEPIELPPSRTPEAQPPEEKPAVGSGINWAAIGAFLSSVAGYLTDWRVVAVIITGILCGIIIWKRSGKPDITGWFKA